MTAETTHLIYPFAGRDVFDPVEAWKRMDEKDRDRFGPAAMAHLSGVLGVLSNLGPRNAFPAADLEGMQALAEIAVEVMPELFDIEAGAVPRPYLPAIGIASCLLCGCTQNCACDEGCGWSDAGGVCTACRRRLSESQHGLPVLTTESELKAMLGASPDRVLAMVATLASEDGLAFVVGADVVGAGVVEAMDPDGDREEDEEPLPGVNLSQIAMVGFHLTLPDIVALGLTGGPAFATWTLPGGKVE